MYVPKVQKLLKDVSGTVPDGLALANSHFARQNMPVPDWGSAETFSSFWDNVVTFSVPNGNGGMTTVSFTTDQLILAHFWRAETYGLTMMHKLYGIRTLADVCKFSRKELCWMNEIGPVTIKELDRIMGQLRLHYYGGRQMLLFPGSLPGIRCD